MTTRTEYADAFETECAQTYPAIDAFERRMGAMVDRAALEDAARVLACPVKVHAPNWQHGRVIYAAARQRLRRIEAPVLLLDVGTAKGFSALILRWVLRDEGIHGRVISLDVIDPAARVRRNTVAEVDGYVTLPETLRSWHEAQLIEFVQADARHWLKAHPLRAHVAVVDGKHTYEAVHDEARLIAACQQSGDLIVFDDLQIPGIAKAVGEVKGYEIEHLAAKPDRVYAVAWKR